MMRKQINVVLTNDIGDNIKIENVMDFLIIFLNIKNEYFIEKIEIDLFQSQMNLKDGIYDKFKNVKSINIYIVENDTETKIKSVSKDLYLYEKDRNLNYIMFYTRPKSKALVK